MHLNLIYNWTRPLCGNVVHVTGKMFPIFSALFSFLKCVCVCVFQELVSIFALTVH